MMNISISKIHVCKVTLLRFCLLCCHHEIITSNDHYLCKVYPLLILSVLLSVVTEVLLLYSILFLLCMLGLCSVQRIVFYYENL